MINWDSHCNEEKENFARQYEKFTRWFSYHPPNDPDGTLYQELLEVKEEIEYYIENTREKYFAYLEENGLKHFDPEENQ